MPHCIIFEDEDLLVINKPVGWNTHSPGRYSGEGIYDWLRNRSPEWASLAIVHRLDKETSGAVVFAKTRLASKSLTEQFTKRFIKKRYLLGTDHNVVKEEYTIESRLERSGAKYISSPKNSSGHLAVTGFYRGKTISGITYLAAEPLTGRTHQIRVHAAELGFPIIGDMLYGGAAAKRLYLHAESLTFQHPATQKKVTFNVPVDFLSDRTVELRKAFIDIQGSNAYRIIHGAADNEPGFYVDRLGGYLLSHKSGELSSKQMDLLKRLLVTYSIKGVYFKNMNKQVRLAKIEDASPKHIMGEAAPEEFSIVENDICYKMSFSRGYSSGIFLDQRDNRYRFLTNYIEAGFPVSADYGRKTSLLNTFAYTCGFSLCAAKAGVRTTNLDLSKKNINRGKDNFILNGFSPDEHDFIYGDVFDWLKRLEKKKRSFDVIILDPPTFSRSKSTGIFRVEKNYGDLIIMALGLLKPKGTLLACANTVRLFPEIFIDTVKQSIKKVNRSILKLRYIPQPPDFPINRAEPGHLKTVWVRVL